MAGSMSKAACKAKSDDELITSIGNTDSSTREPTAGVVSASQLAVVKSLREHRHLIFFPPRSPHAPKIEPRWKRRQWMRNLQAWIQRHNRLWYPWRSRKNKQTSYDDTHAWRSHENIFTFDIVMEVTDTNGNPRFRHGKALVDYWSPYNIISRKFGNVICDDLHFRTPYPLINTLAGTTNAVKKIQARLHSVNDPQVPKSLLKFDETFDDSEFHILENGAARFDFIIGRPDIIKFDILNIQARVPLADEGAAALKQQQKMDEIRRNAKWKKRRDQYARTKAHSLALDYAEKHVARYGPEYHEEAYHLEFARQFLAAKTEFTRLDPRT